MCVNVERDEKNMVLKRVTWHLGSSRLNEVVKITFRGRKHSDFYCDRFKDIKKQRLLLENQIKGARLRDVPRCTCCLNIFSGHQRNGLWHSHFSSVHYVGFHVFS